MTGRGESYLDPEIRSQLINSRLLILQSKRLMLKSLQRRVDGGGRSSLHAQIDTVRREIDHAQHAYRACVLTHGFPENNDYWLTAYSRLIEMGNALAVKLRDATNELPLSERYEVSADVEMLEEIVESWGVSLRAAMAAEVA